MAWVWYKEFHQRKLLTRPRSCITTSVFCRSILIPCFSPYKVNRTHLVTVLFDAITRQKIKTNGSCYANIWRLGLRLVSCANENSTFKKNDVCDHLSVRYFERRTKTHKNQQQHNNKYTLKKLKIFFPISQNKIVSLQNPYSRALHATEAQHFKDDVDKTPPARKTLICYSYARFSSR